MISFRDITDLEPITSIPDNADIVVVVDGVAKRISKENAKFGGGTVEKKVFYIGTKAGTTGYYTIYTDAACTTLATAQEVFDACWERTIEIHAADAEQSGVLFPQEYAWVSSDGVGAHTNVVYTHLQMRDTFADVGVDPNAE